MLPTQPVLDGHATRSRCRWRSGHEFYEPTEILGNCCKRELILCAARAAQSQPVESENALQVREQHLNALAVAPGLLEGVGSGERASHVTGVFVNVASDYALWSVRATLGLKRTRATVAGARQIPKLVLGENPPGRL